MLTIITISLITSGICSFLANWGLRKSGVDFFGKMNVALNGRANTDIILIGSSRTLVQLDPRIIDSFTAMHSYNYGLNAATIKTCYNFIAISLANEPDVKMVVLNIDYNMFDPAQDLYKDPYYFAYRDNTSGIVSIQSRTDAFIHDLRIFDIAMYDDKVKYAAIDGFLRPGKIAEGIYKGYFPNRDMHFAKPKLPNTPTNTPFTEEGMKLLNRIIALCKEKKKKLVMIMAPYALAFYPGKYSSNYADIIAKIKVKAAQQNISFLDYTTVPFATDTAFFYNSNHLNITGAQVYSKLVALDLQKLLQDTMNDTGK